MADLPLIPGTLAEDCYPASAQAFYEEMFDKGHAVGDDVVGLLIQDAAPDPAQRDQGWIPTSGGVPIYPGYVFVWNVTVGHWVSRHPKGPVDPRPEMYIGTLPDLVTFDGGDANPPGIGSGPMWEQWTPITGRVPIGVGLVPTSSPAATVTAPLDTIDTLGNIGEYKHSLVPDEMQHMHGCAENALNLDPLTQDDPALQLHRAWTSAPDSYVTSGNNMSSTSTGYIDGVSISAGDFGTSKALTDPDFPVVDGHNNMQPYIGVYWIQRTARQFYVLG